MASNYIDLIAVRLDNCEDLLLVRAPRGSQVKEGQLVLVETANGAELGTAEAVADWVEQDSDTKKIIKKLTKTPADEELGKCLAYFVQVDLEYDDDNV